MRVSNTSVIILAGGTLKSKFDYLKVSSECPALLPVNCKAIASYIISFYSKQKNCNIYLATNLKYKEEIQQELATFDFEFEYIFMPETDSVISSLDYAMTKISPSESVIVNLVTSIPSVFPNINDIQFSNETNISKLWSGYILEKNEIIFKKDNSENQPFNAFTGIFHLSSNKLRDCIQKQGIDKSDLFSLFKNENFKAFNISMSDWLDCGHEVNYYETKTKLISSRSFNNISFTNRGVIKKSSVNISKLKDEVEYYKLLPSNISILFPRLVKDFYKDGDKGAYELEFYGYPNIAELILFWDLSYDVLRRMFSHFSEILNQFSNYSGKLSKQEFRNFYLGKLYSRVDEYLNSLNKNDLEVINKVIVVNGKKCRPFSELKEFIEKRTEQLYNENDLCIMHGDFCYNNVLYDVPTGIVKLIDPRGSFSDDSKGIYGDRKYDLAKLAHSAIGGYDFFVNNKYKMIRDGNSFVYSFGNKKHEITSVLMKELIENSGQNYNDIHFIMGTLFLSMCPLHTDSPKRQMTFYVHGLRILNEIVDEES